MFESMLSFFDDLKVVPVVVIDDPDAAPELASALVEGGLPTAEVTLRTPNALACIERMAENPDLVPGAGTVLTVEDAVAAIEAGARYIVSPGYSERVVRYCIERGVPVLPGTVTPSEIIAAKDLGLTCTKFFPAKVYGGEDALKALGSVFVGHEFMPTGGINPDNLKSYLGVPCVRACGGTWIASQKLVEAHDFDAIRANCREARALAASA